MIVGAPHVYRMLRPYADVTDLTSSVETGPRTVEFDRASGEAVMIIPFDVEPSTSEQEAIIRRLTSASSIEEELMNRASQALTVNDTFLALGSPTNAQILAQVRALARQNNAIIRLVMKWLDSA